ncbi:MAG: hypothetical protein BWY75_02957 [bacterium ADurb.Bin425]|nr:MAG: hypothetical protein BWY75_02957 [bacterium ADurb.Bin425]
MILAAFILAHLPFSHLLEDQAGGIGFISQRCFHTLGFGIGVGGIAVACSRAFIELVKALIKDITESAFAYLLAAGNSRSKQEASEQHIRGHVAGHTLDQRTVADE